MGLRLGVGSLGSSGWFRVSGTTIRSTS